MQHFCTIADSKYMLQVLALYNSLCKTIPDNDFRLHILFADENIFRTVMKMELSDIIPYNLSTLEEIDSKLFLLKKNSIPHPRQPATSNSYSQYIWALTPYFINLLLQKKHIKSLMYIDVDICMYQNPQTIFDAIGGKAVGIHTHRFTGNIENHLSDDGVGSNIDVGWYNVGVLVFNNTLPGRNISNTWENWLFNSNNMFFDNYGSCGDQKYLELFIPLFGHKNVCVFDDEGKIFHMAPWCAENPKNQLPAFYHFSHFNYDLVAGTWKDNIQSEWNPSKEPHIRPLYEDYFSLIRVCNEMVKKKLNNA